MKLKLAGAALLGVLLSLITFTTASAHHPLVSGTTQCRTDAWTVTWTARADADRDLTWRITSPAGYSPSGSQGDHLAFTKTVTYPATQTSATETVNAAWSKHGDRFGFRDGRASTAVPSRHNHHDPGDDDIDIFDHFDTGDDDDGDRYYDDLPRYLDDYATFIIVAATVVTTIVVIVTAVVLIAGRH